jgi:hypothetical protein
MDQIHVGTPLRVALAAAVLSRMTGYTTSSIAAVGLGLSVGFAVEFAERHLTGLTAAARCPLRRQRPSACDRA